jgi:hypothetical protein
MPHVSLLPLCPIRCSCGCICSCTACTSCAIPCRGISARFTPQVCAEERANDRRLLEGAGPVTGISSRGLNPNTRDADDVDDESSGDNSSSDDSDDDMEALQAELAKIKCAPGRRHCWSCVLLHCLQTAILLACLAAWSTFSLLSLLVHLFTCSLIQGGEGTREG